MFISEADVDGVDTTEETPLLSNLQAEIYVLRVTISPSPQSKDEENEKLHKLREYARDFRRQHTTDAEQFDWDSDDGDYSLAIGRLVVT
jgi:alpha-ketoglutarate-dependent taurine dioxygenase